MFIFIFLLTAANITSEDVSAPYDIDQIKLEYGLSKVQNDVDSVDIFPSPDFRAFRKDESAKKLISSRSARTLETRKNFEHCHFQYLLLLLHISFFTGFTIIMVRVEADYKVQGTKFV